MNVLDLRSDTVTLPSKEMLDSITSAELGDDVFGEDPTVNQLQRLAAERFGAEASLLVPSGTMANLVSVMTHCRRGDEVIVEQDAHIYYYEVGGLSAIAGTIPRWIKGDMGIYTAQQLRDTVRAPDLHLPPTTLVSIENTHNRAGGTVWTPKQVEEVAETAHDLGAKVHIDGARIFNACVALDVSPREYMRHVDSISFCLSKGLSCPVGSLIVSNADFISKARKNRKILGGGMRQAGVIAAPGIVALNTMVDRLKEDHENAKRLAKGLSGIDGVRIDMMTVQTNIVLADVSGTGMTSEEVSDRLEKEGVLVVTFGPKTIRFVTHHGIVANDIENALARAEKALESRSR
ncbi:MAG: aminotransferase class I/II-fold pyridoxal phosphate-dependent enzyme [Methanomassiliicoccales archaeon]|nr:aminotransferase class I/II-fold pyridoxal phosphate-dependent enzyme [Methanomassiliicoccales archaeon]